MSSTGTKSADTDTRMDSTERDLEKRMSRFLQLQDQAESQQQQNDEQSSQQEQTPTTERGLSGTSNTVRSRDAYVLPKHGEALRRILEIEKTKAEHRTAMEEKESSFATSRSGETERLAAETKGSQILPSFKKDMTQEEKEDLVSVLYDGLMFLRKQVQDLERENGRLKEGLLNREQASVRKNELQYMEEKVKEFEMMNEILKKGVLDLEEKNKKLQDFLAISDRVASHWKERCEKLEKKNVDMNELTFGHVYNIKDANVSSFGFMNSCVSESLTYITSRIQDRPIDLEAFLRKLHQKQTEKCDQKQAKECGDQKQTEECGDNLDIVQFIIKICNPTDNCIAYNWFLPNNYVNFIKSQTFDGQIIEQFKECITQICEEYSGKELLCCVYFEHIDVQGRKRGRGHAVVLCANSEDRPSRFVDPTN